MLVEESNLKTVKDFISHNLDCRYITKDTTIEELLKYINNIEDNYIPIIKAMRKKIIVSK